MGQPSTSPILDSPKSPSPPPKKKVGATTEINLRIFSGQETDFPFYPIRISLFLSFRNTKLCKKQKDHFIHNVHIGTLIQDTIMMTFKLELTGLTAAYNRHDCCLRIQKVVKTITRIIRSLLSTWKTKVKPAVSLPPRNHSRNRGSTCPYLP